MAATFTAFDLETSHKQAQHARIVQWALVTFERGSDGTYRQDPLRRHVALVDPGVQIPTEASRIHGIYEADIIAAPTTRQSLPWLLSCMQLSLLVGYNLVDYDLEVLRAECARYNLLDHFHVMMSSLQGVVDVMPWAARTTPAPMYKKGARTLATMSQRHGVVLDAAHDASDDATATGLLMLSLIEKKLMPPLDDVVEATKGTWQHLRK